MKMAVVQVQQWCTDISATRGLDGYNDGLDKAAEWAAEFQKATDALLALHPDEQPAIDELLAAFTPYYETGQQMAQAYIELGPAGGNEMMGEFDTVAGAINDLVDEMLNGFQAEYDEAMLAVQTNGERIVQANHQLIFLVAVGIVLIALVILVLLWVLADTIRSVTMLSKQSLIMSQGDFTQEIQRSKAKDELGQMTNAFIEMKTNTQNLIRKVSESATSVATSSEELSAGADETGRAIQDVAKTVEQVAIGSQSTTTHLGQAQQSLDQNSQAVDTVSKDIEDVASYASRAVTQGEEGRKSADSAVKIITRAARSVDETSQVVKTLGDKTSQIGGFITIITGIADQTNLLALNAAIEAARAGEAGRGFAVVAEEVRKLAEESSQAAGNITSLIKGIEAEMQNALQAMDQSNTEVNDGAVSVSQASSLLAEIVNGIIAVNEKVQNISAAAEQITASTSEVVNVIASVASIAEENAAASEEVSSSTEEQTASMQEINANANQLAKLAQDLQMLIAEFKV
ncbi:methyl-accepting chemotaxis protein [bacterium]|nr:methyl-accepting chemotaxis protein [bacterium]